jgi:hypothetical protein
MTQHATDQWEETLDAYLEGRSLRADAEDLLMRLHLSADDRDEIERSLRLTDELTLTLRQAQPPTGAEQRLLNQLRACAVPAELPEDWRVTESGEMVRPAGSPMTLAEEDLLDAALEGRVTMKELVNLRDTGQLTEGGAEAVEELRLVAEAITDLSPARRSIPTGMKGRLRNKLESHIMSEAGEIDGKVIERLLGDTPQAKPRLAMPDVLAAEENPEENDE